MVIWLFAGGGPPEYSGLVKLLQKSFPDYQFERQLPQLAQKPIGKPQRFPQQNSPTPKIRSTTGRDLIKAISERLSYLLTRNSLEERLTKNTLCDAILVIDDLDCRRWENSVCNNINSPGFHQLRHSYHQQIYQSLSSAREQLDEGIKHRLEDVGFKPKIIIGFASPEIEAWIIADWGNCQHRDFPQHQWIRMRKWLRDEAEVDFRNPEPYGGFNAETGVCHMKLSEKIVEASTQAQWPQQLEPLCRYNKARHSSELLEILSSQRVQRKCPIFRAMYQSLQSLSHSG